MVSLKGNDRVNMQPTPPGLRTRLAVLLYEATLLFGLTFVTALLVLLPLGWRFPLDGIQRLALQAVVVVVLGVYFVWCWVKGGQTLPMRTWRIRVVEADGRRLRAGRAILRYLLAWHFFVPGLLFAAFFPGAPRAALIAGGIGLLLALLPAAFGRRQLLHDRVLGTRVERVEAAVPKR